ncbi:hypothetical protein ESCO_006615 [Escovopsis weberi]|uniref:AB hydrolase-1 domain-containing protein n=1 Tax=Escovopsis weberi TaxID=150374 RepID=A0A0M9VXR1_ESCWE|nr:hypothetical protein ESCO_006615 [Escovopsis weberi]
MIGSSIGGCVFIRFWVLLFRYTPVIYLASLAALHLRNGRSAAADVAARVLYGLLAAELLFYLLIYLPFTRRLTLKAVHPDPPSPEARRALFDQCMDNVHDMEHYLRWWFQGAEMVELRRDNLREFLHWAFFGFEGADDGEKAAIEREIDSYIARMEGRLGYALLDGKGSARSIRLTLDDVETTYRSLLWYIVMFSMDQMTHLALLWHGFHYYARDVSSAIKTFPPRPQELLAGRRSRGPSLSYYHRPHRSRDALPVLFIHGIGIGLWTYIRFLADIYAAGRSPSGKDGTGVVAIEILPVSFRLTSPPLDKAEFLRQISAILNHHGLDRFTVVSHSYGSVPTAHMIRCPTLKHRIRSVVLIDPVSILLHCPDVAYNFTRRRPQKANEWQLWYFASTDPGVAHCLGRHFFWQENILWKEDLLDCSADNSAQNGAGAIAKGTKTGRRVVAVCLAGQDILVDTASVARYLAGQVPFDEQVNGHEAGIKVIMFPTLDHAQVFDSPPECDQVVQLIRLYCNDT